MEIFTFTDYFKCRNLCLKYGNKFMTLCDINEEYIIHQKHDKIFKTIFDNKEEAAKFINKTLELKNKLTKDKLEKYSSSYITRIFQNQEADIVYKIKEKDIFFLIEHQSKVDYSMPFRILMYQIEIMRSAMDISKMNTKGYKMPLVIPIVLYTGKQKWNAAKVLKEAQEMFDEEIKDEASKYNLVDINDYNKEELIEENSFYSKVFILEKAKDTKELTEALMEIMPKIKEEEKELMKRIISLILIRKIGEEKTEEILEKEERGKKIC